MRSGLPILGLVVSALLAIGLVSVVVSWLSRRPGPPVRFRWAPPEEAALDWEGQVLETPSLHAFAQHKKIITCYAPARGAFLTQMPSLPAHTVALQITKAANAAPQWAKTSFEERRAVMRSLADWIVRDKELIARVCARDTGKTMLDAAFGEIYPTLSKLQHMIKHGEAALAPERRPTNLMLAHKVAEVRYEPLGVVAAIVSWNYCFHNLISPIIAALFAGNAVVVKASEHVAWSSQSFAQAIRNCIAAHGHDPDLVQVLIGAEKEAAEALTGDDRIQHLTFIGSEAVGRSVAARCGSVGTDVTLELGGKDPGVVLPSADIKSFTPHFMRATFQAAGQNCIGTERWIVHSDVYDAFVAAVNPIVAALRVGDPLDTSIPEPCDVGAMVTDARFDELETLVAEAIKAGARLMVGGKRLRHGWHPKGHYFEPTLLIDVRADMLIAQTELFAPVMLVMKAETIEEAISIANGSRYALGASVYGRNKGECDFVVSQLRCGQVSVNDFGVFYLNQSLPFGGVGNSGYGRFGGKEGLRALCSTKSIVRDRFHGIVQTMLPTPLRYPVAPHALRVALGTADLVFGDRLKGLRAMLGI